MNNKTMFNLSYGLFVCSANKDGFDNGCIINTVMQVASDPNRICISIHKANLTHDMVYATKKFTISILNVEADFEMFKHFGFQSGRNVNKFENFKDIKRLENNTLCITKGVNGYICGEVIHTIDVGSHTLFIADVTDMDILNDVESMTYAYYHNHVKPQSKDSKKEKGKWVCKICGYVYEGEDLPEDYICPLCKHPASDFERR